VILLRTLVVCTKTRGREEAQGKPSAHTSAQNIVFKIIFGPRLPLAVACDAICKDKIWERSSHTLEDSGDMVCVRHA
jgi:hypothetical protein